MILLNYYFLLIYLLFFLFYLKQTNTMIYGQESKKDEYILSARLSSIKDIRDVFLKKILSLFSAIISTGIYDKYRRQVDYKFPYYSHMLVDSNLCLIRVQLPYYLLHQSLCKI